MGIFAYDQCVSHKTDDTDQYNFRDNLMDYVMRHSSYVVDRIYFTTEDTAAGESERFYKDLASFSVILFPLYDDIWIPVLDTTQCKLEKTDLWF